jgi:predicted CoA-binding protein
MRDSYRIMAYLMRTGFKVIPVNPKADEVLGQRVYADLRGIDTPIDTVVCFRRSEEIEPIAEAAIAIKAKNLWMQLGVVNPSAKRKAEAAGLQVVMDRCVMVDHRAWRVNPAG